MSDTSELLRRSCDEYSRELALHIARVQYIQANFTSFLARIEQALQGLPRMHPLEISQITFSEFSCFAKIMFEKSSTFLALLPYLDKLGEMGNIESWDSTLAPMRIYQLTHRSPLPNTDNDVAFIFKLYVNIPEDGTDTCKVEVIIPELSPRTPLPEYVLVCKG